jgi:hypothetical protein
MLPEENNPCQRQRNEEVEHWIMEKSTNFQTTMVSPVVKSPYHPTNYNKTPMSW